MPAEAQIANCLSIDVEGFYEARLQSLSLDPSAVHRSDEIYEIEANVNHILGILDAHGVRATFYFTGSAAADLPHLVQQVSGLGHEVGSHNYVHIRVPDLGERQFRAGLAPALRQLEDLTGKPVYGFRAPQFSIDSSCMWAADVLRSEGVVYDSSMYPFALRQSVKESDPQPHIHRLPNGLVEFPATTVPLWNRRLPAGGGGYYRLFPIEFSWALMASVNRRGDPCMFYIHPYELGPVVPEMPNLSPFWKFRLYYNSRGASDRFERLLKRFVWAPAVEILTSKGLLEASGGH